MKPHTKSGLWAFFLTILAFGALFGYKYYTATVKILPTPDYSCDKSVARRLQLLTEHYRDSLGQTSIYVWDITADSLLYADNADLALTPASCQKIITTFAAYDHLAEYNNAFTDSLLLVGKIDRHGNARGHLVYKGSYDPLRYDFEDFAKALKKKGIKTIYGDLVCQLHVQQKYENEDIPHDSLPVLYKGADEVAADLRSQLAKVGVYVTGKTMFINPGAKLPESPVASKDNDEDDAPAVAKADSSSQDTTRNGKRQAQKDTAERAKADSDSAAEQEVEDLIPSQLADGTLLLCSDGHTLEEIMTHLMQHSDNRSAEAVLFCLSQSSGTAKKNEDLGVAIIRQSLQKFFPNLTEKQCHIADGSGLSYDNKCTSHLLVDLLRVSHNYGLLGNFLVNEAMPKSGATGTLRSRMKGTPAEGNVCAKTGTLPQFPASSLAGYCQSTRGHLLAFCIISNGPKSRAGNDYIRCAKRFENEFCIEMCR